MLSRSFSRVPNVHLNAKPEILNPKPKPETVKNRSFSTIFKP